MGQQEGTTLDAPSDNTSMVVNTDIMALYSSGEALIDA